MTGIKESVSLQVCSNVYRKGEVGCVTLLGYDNLVRALYDGLPPAKIN